MFGNVLVAIDIEDRESWWKMLEQAKACLDHDTGKLRLLYVRPELPDRWRDFATPDLDVVEQERCEAKIAGLAKLTGLASDRVSYVVRSGSVHDETLHEAESCRADVIVVGPHRTSITGLLLGSSATMIVRHATIPVLVVR